MRYLLENPFMRLEIDPAASAWSLSSSQAASPNIRAARTRLSYRLRNGGLQALETWPQAVVSEIESAASPHGSLRQRQVHFGQGEGGLKFTLTFALPDNHPLLFWRLSLENCGHDPLRPARLELLRLGHGSGDLRWQSSVPDLAFFSHGWQSWSYSAAYGASEHMRRTRLGLLQRPVNENPSTPRSGQAGVFTSEMFAVLGDRTSRQGLLAGFLSQRQHFGSLQAWCDPANPALHLWAEGDNARLDPGAVLNSDWACLATLNLDDPDPLGPYLEAVARENAVQVGERPIPTGWCSWYHYSNKINPDNLRSNLQAMVDLRPGLPLDLFQIDSGFESQVSDWLTFKPAFPQGIAPLADEARLAGLTPGLWLAPFIVHPKSRLKTEHPDWLLRGGLNRPVNAGFFWNTLPTALDLTHPGAQEYVHTVIDTAAHRWGFPYLKLDFLFAAGLPGRHHDPMLTRAQVLRQALQAVRAAAGEETFLLGCGCPLGSAVGLVDAMRVSADVDVRWYPSIHGIRFIYGDEPHVPAARHVLQNTLARAALHRRWWINDPDCLLLRPETELTLAEVQSLATAIALSGGSLLLSDALAALPQERRRIAETLLPLIGQRPRVADWLDAQTPRHVRLDLENATGQWHLLALFNWEDSPQELSLKPSDYGLDNAREYLGREFWSGQTYSIPRGKLALPGVPAHGVVLLALRPLLPGAPQYLGGDLHISQGLEVSGWETAQQGLGLCLERPGRIRGNIDLRLPHAPGQVFVNDEPVECQGLSQEIFRLHLEASQRAEIRLAWSETHE